MQIILERYTRSQIAAACGVSYRTVLNWVKLETVPLWAIKRLGFTVAQIKKGGPP